jgi:hypothetical protein
LHSNVFTVASLTVITTFFAKGPDAMREIRIKPFFHSWPHFTPVLGQVHGLEALYFRSWQGGIVFANGVYLSQGPRVFPDKKAKSHPPIYGANLAKHHLPILPDTSDVTFEQRASHKCCVIKRKHVPIMPGFEVTTHKVKGQNMERVVVELVGCSGME